MKTIAISDFLALPSEIPILDVRAPTEYEQGHLPDAVSFPLFSDEERAEIGTLYKQVSQEAAIAKGWEVAEPKIPAFLEKAAELGSTLRIHCWRGGMRSNKMAELLTSHGHDVYLLEGGYRSYRRALTSFFSSPLSLIVLTGHTGSMKTEVLHRLGEVGEQLIDLEGAANHQGSSFGNAHTTGQPTTEHFQNRVFEQARTLDTSKRIWIEDESFMIGKCALIAELYEQMQRSPHLRMDVDVERRLTHLVHNYGQLNPEKLMQATNGIRQRLGHQRCDEALEAIGRGDMRAAAREALVYYDKQYAKTLSKKSDHIVWEVSFSEESIADMADALIHAVG